MAQMEQASLLQQYDLQLGIGLQSQGHWDMLHKESCGPRLCIRMNVISWSSSALARSSRHPPGKKQGQCKHHTMCYGCFGGNGIGVMLDTYMLELWCGWSAMVHVVVKEHDGAVGQCTQQDNHNSPLPPINRQHTQISLCCPGLVLGNMIWSLYPTLKRVRVFVGLMPEAWDCGLWR